MDLLTLGLGIAIGAVLSLVYARSRGTFPMPLPPAGAPVAPESGTPSTPSEPATDEPTTVAASDQISELYRLADAMSAALDNAARAQDLESNEDFQGAVALLADPRMALEATSSYTIV